ncbi:MAG: methyltransferase [Gammaproteobacteria bacterium]
MKLQKNSLPVRLFSLAATLITRFQAFTNRMTPAPFRLIQAGSAFWLSRVLYVATRLDIAGILANETLSVSDIATKVSAQPDAINRMLRFLASRGIFSQVRPGYFSNNKISAYLREDNPHNVRSMILMHNSREMSQPWYEQLEAAIRTGGVPFRLAHQEELYCYTSTHNEFGALFNSAMETVEALSGDSFAVDFNWGNFARLFDLGGGVGSKAVTILRHYPQLQAEVIDSVSVIQNAREYWQHRLDNGLLQRLTFSSGDIRGACIAVMEMVMDTQQPDMLSTAADMQMFMGTRGRERSLDEWHSLFNQSGIQLAEVVRLRNLGCILVARS